MKKLKNIQPTAEIVIQFLEKVLPSFTPIIQQLPENERLKIGNSEPDWNGYLETFLNRRARAKEYSFFFKGEPKEGTRKVDIGAMYAEIESYKPFFVIECKRLPTPPNSQRLKMEYVCGKNTDGGIERFKLNLHGVNLPHNAMIAYIEKEDFSFWHEKINTWIEEVGWENEFLTQPTINKIAILNSKHKRQNDEVELTHFWLNLQT